MRVILFTGKGGVGKTTAAAATAVRAARGGIKTLILSTDAAHSIGDAFGLELAAPDGGGSLGPAAGVEVEPGLFALQVDAAHRGSSSWRAVQDYLLSLLDVVGVDPVVAEEISSLPGMEELVALLELRAQVVAGPFDLIIVDCAPTAATLRLLALPQVLARHLERLLPSQSTLWRSLRPAAAAVAGVPLPDAEVLATVRRWHARLSEVQSILTAPTTTVRVVLTPERVVIAEARRTLTALSLHGLVVDQAVVNRVFPTAADTTDDIGDVDSWRSGWNSAQRSGLVEVHESFDPVEVVALPYLPQEPIGADALMQLAAASVPPTGAAADVLAAPTREGLTLRRSDTGYDLSLPLPLVRAEEVDLRRRPGELLVAVGGHRRVLSLPSALQRCTVTQATVQHGRLRISFKPDERVWPHDT